MDNQTLKEMADELRKAERRYHSWQAWCKREAEEKMKGGNENGI